MNGKRVNGVLALGLLIALGTWTTVCCGATSAPPHTEILQKAGEAFAAIAEHATPAVVFIKAEKTFAVGMRGQPFGYNDPRELFGDEFSERYFFGRRYNAPRRAPREFKQMGQGSGFIITKDGTILTNHHVVGDADKITVKLEDGREFEAELIGSDPKSEVAVIKINGKNLPYLNLGDSAASRVGEWAIAIGNPFGLTATVTAGIISAKGRSGMGIADYESFLQTDAAINPGNSGGPLLNIAGEVIGINTAIYSNTGGAMGIGFAIPIDMAKSIKDQLVKDGKVSRGYLGIIIQDLTPDLSESFGIAAKHGILVADIAEGSPAAESDLRQGDVVLLLNGKPTDGVGAFRNNVASNPPGTKVTLTVLRDGSEMDITLKAGRLPEDTDMASGSSALSESLGFRVQNLSKEAIQRFGYEPDEGVLVAEVEQGSLGWQAGIEPGNLITSVNRRPVSTAREFGEAVNEARQVGTLLLRVRDERYARYIVLHLE